MTKGAHAADRPGMPDTWENMVFLGGEGLTQRQ